MYKVSARVKVKQVTTVLLMLTGRVASDAETVGSIGG